MTTSFDTKAYRRIFEPMSRTREGWGLLRRPLRLPQFAVSFVAAGLVAGAASFVIKANLLAAYWQIPLISFLIPILLFLLLFLILLPVQSRFCRILLTEDSLIEESYGRRRKINLTFGKPRVTLQENGLVAFSTSDEKIVLSLNEKGGYEFFTILKTKYHIEFPGHIYELFDIARHRAEGRAEPPQGGFPYDRPDDEE